MKIIPIKRALLSVSDKTGVVEFAQQLAALGVEIISTGGTSKLLTEANVAHRQVDEVTGMTEMLDGRVKTLHPKIHGGILGRRDVHAKEAEEFQIDWIDLVVVNFYPFAEAIKNKQMDWAEAVEYIDIGGPTMVRAAAKNFAWVSVVTDPKDYAAIIHALREEQGISFEMRKQLAQKVFSKTAAYDAMIRDYFLQQDKSSASVVPCEDAGSSSELNLHLSKYSDLRYGENPHQKASAYQFKTEKKGIFAAHQHQGKPLSYNNMLDAEAAVTCLQEFDEPACVIVKHANPCGVSVAENIHLAFSEALEADRVSAFGGIISLNRECGAEIAKEISQMFVEVVIAPAFTDEALALFATKPNLRVLVLPKAEKDLFEMKFITGGLLVQEKDPQWISKDKLQVVTQLSPSDEDLNAMMFSWRVLKHIKSNGILIAKKNTTIGIGAGQVSRIDAVDLAVRKAREKIAGSVLASDAFFPFRDSIDRLAGTGVRAVIQPGGSVRDEEVISACNEHGIAMVFTGMRCFRH